VVRPVTQWAPDTARNRRIPPRGKSTIRATPRQICDIFGHAPDRTIDGGAFAARCILLRQKHRPVATVFGLCCPLEGKGGPSFMSLSPMRWRPFVSRFSTVEIYNWNGAP
jgi:hypothetical protein